MKVKWIVLLIACVRAFFATGSVKVSGVFLEEMTQKLNTSHLFVAWALALQHGIALIIAPFSLILLELFGCRAVFVVGAFIGGGGYILCGLFTDNVWQLFLWFCLSGIGFGFCSLPIYIAIQTYFQEKFLLVTCIVHLFQFVGVATLPTIFMLLRKSFLLNQSLILYGALIWNLAALGFGLPSLQAKRSIESENERKIVEEKTSTEESVTTTRLKENCEKRSMLFNVRRWFSIYLSLIVHKNFITLVIAHSNQKGVIFTSWALILVSYGESVGLTTEQAVFLSTIGGIGGFFGKFVAIMLCKFERMNMITFYVIPCVVIGSSLMFCIYARSFYLICMLMFIVGFGLALNLSGLSGVLPSTVCKSHFPVAAAVLHVVEGICVQFGGLCAGVIYDVTSSTLYVIGLNVLLSFLMLLALFVWDFSDKPMNETCGRENIHHQDAKDGRN